jgi:hypothetical protein
MKKELISRKFFIAAIFVVLVSLLILLYFIYFYHRPCEDRMCFDSAMKSCNRVDYVKEDEAASWLYRIIGSNKDACKVEVTLLNLKKGTIDIEKLQGKKMVCEVKRYDNSDPGSDISKCAGELKEELQDIIIQRLNNYVVSNINEIIPRLSS